MDARGRLGPVEKRRGTSVESFNFNFSQFVLPMSQTVSNPREMSFKESSYPSHVNAVDYSSGDTLYS